MVGYLTSQQHASVSHGRVCSDNCTCCHTEVEVADQTFYLTQSRYINTGRTSLSAEQKKKKKKEKKKKKNALHKRESNRGQQVSRGTPLPLGRRGDHSQDHDGFHDEYRGDGESDFKDLFYILKKKKKAIRRFV